MNVISSHILTRKFKNLKNLIGRHYTSIEAIQKCKEHLGPSTLVIGRDKTQALSNYLLSLCGNNGVMGYSYTVKNNFLTENIITEGINIARRTGISSIICHGDNHILDCGKGITVQLKEKYKIPIYLITMPAYVTTSPYLSDWTCMNTDCDMLISKVGIKPQLILHLKELHSPNTSLALLRDNLLCEIFDCIFVAALNRATPVVCESDLKDRIPRLFLFDPELFALLRHPNDSL